ncbi:MAG: multiheme c-type cytochrome, partial [Deltaproteobacteria bacterium]
PQWEMYSGSKHGVRYLLKQKGVLPETATAPTCQTCHMVEGNHEVRTAWGFLAVRLPMPEDKQWAQARATILQALGVLDPAGKPTARIELAKAADLARLTEKSWMDERIKMEKVCNGCHSLNFAKGELGKADDMIREADLLLAEAIGIVADLYEKGLLKKPKNYAYPFPDLLAFHDAPTSLEQELWLMWMEYRMRAFQGAFHANPDYTFWYGWSEMRQSLTRIKEMAEDLKRRSR